jgi:hypothetical protein
MLNSLTRWAIVLLAAGAAIVLSRMAPAAEPAAAGSSALIGIHWDGTSMLVTCFGRTLMDYCRVANPAKPYVRRLYTPGGVNVLRDEVPDHKHHHGLMFAIAAEGVNFWEEAPGCGREEPQGGCPASASEYKGSARASLSQELDRAQVAFADPAGVPLDLRRPLQGRIGHAARLALDALRAARAGIGEAHRQLLLRPGHEVRGLDE